VITRVSQFPFFTQSSQQYIPAVQFLTLPLNDHHQSLRRRGQSQRLYTTSTITKLSTRYSSFPEDYDEWYSHGRVGSVTSTVTEEEFYYQQPEENSFTNSKLGIQRGFLLDELKQEESIKCQFDESITTTESGILNLQEDKDWLLFEDDDDDDLDDLIHMTEDDFDILEDS